ncbi:MAG: type II toxin-antitoxin system HicB family antitoxin [Clostridia bacterium]|jgi:predicted RNase H-like HicB family nuclease|nr:type II toxin-antitoxin system HicB family antitoxin [Clostridia bacterium]MDD4146216.1 type II toxin-antitoxin system HicB family antitoxin [Clostridia bacterium]MDD4665771.1 type II toxin-antitoxin system HicB family antitoxin [Clostridia bacterium]
MKLVYPACFYPCEESGYTVTFPDLPGCITEGDTLAEAVDMAIDAASGWLLDEVENNKALPKPSDIKSIVANEYENGFVSLISVDLDEYAKKIGNKAVKKTLTIPAWLNTIAEKENVNYSQLLQRALAKHLKIKQP